MNSIKFFFSVICACTFHPSLAQVPRPDETLYEVAAPPPDEDNILKNEVLIFTEKGKFGLKKNESVLLAPVYDELLKISSSLFQLKQNGKFGVADKKGSILIPVQFDSIKTNFAASNTIVVYQNGKAGALSNRGTEILPTQYDQILYANDISKYSLAVKDGKEILFYGAEQVKQQYQSLVFYFNLVVIKQNDKYGILKKGALVTPAEYDSIFAANQKSYKTNSNNTSFFDYRMFANTLFCMQNNKYGLLDNDGTVITAAVNDNIQFDRYRKVFHIKKDSLTGLYFENTKKITNIEFQSVIGDGIQYMTVKKNRHYGVINYYTQQIIPCEYDSINNLGGSIGFKVKQNRKTGLLTDKGKELIPVMYDDVEIFSLADKLRGVYKITLNGHYGIANAAGKVIVPPLYDGIFEKGNFLSVLAGKNYGLYSAVGKQVCDTVYQDFKLSSTKYSRVIFSYKDSSKGIIKDDGTILYEPVLKTTGYITTTEGLLNPYSFNKGKYLYVQDRNNKLGILDEAKAEMVVPVKYDGIYQKMETSGLTYFSVKKGNKYGIINNNDSIVLPFIYDSVDMTRANPDTYDEPQFVVKKGNLYGAVSLSGKTRIPLKYSNLVKLSNDNFYKAKSKNHYLLVDGNNKIINAGPFDDISLFEGNIALSFYNGKMKLLNKKGAFISEETTMQPPVGYTTFEELKQALIKALNSTDSKELETFAYKAAPSSYSLYFIKRNIFTGADLGYPSVEAIREKYYKDLLYFKKTKWETGTYNKTKLTAVDDYTFSDEGLITNTRTEELSFGDTRFLEKLLQGAVRVNGYWISTYFMKTDFDH